MNDRYVVRYRRARPDGVPALIVEDAAGAAWLFVGGTLRCALPYSPGDGLSASDRLMRHLGGAARWSGVPKVAPYSLAGLQQLIAGIAPVSRRPTPPRRVLAPARGA